MTFGVDQIPTGRPKGAANKDISLGRQAIARFVDDNAHRLLEWLDAIAEKDAKQAFDAYMSVVEFHIPKLSRAENINKTVGILQIVLEAGKAQQAALNSRSEALEGDAHSVGQLPKVTTEISEAIVQVVGDDSMNVAASTTITTT